MADIIGEDETGPRAGRREANLRLLNERIVDATARLAGDAGPGRLRIACECANDDCRSTIDVDADTFAELRESRTRFAVVEGHVLADVERVVGHDDGWAVVEKVGSAARAAIDRLS